MHHTHTHPAYIRYTLYNHIPSMHRIHTACTTTKVYTSHTYIHTYIHTFKLYTLHTMIHALDISCTLYICMHHKQSVYITNIHTYIHTFKLYTLHTMIHALDISCTLYISYTCTCCTHQKLMFTSITHTHTHTHTH